MEGIIIGIAYLMIVIVFSIVLWVAVEFIGTNIIKPARAFILRKVRKGKLPAGARVSGVVIYSVKIESSGSCKNGLHQNICGAIYISSKVGKGYFERIGFSGLRGMSYRGDAPEASWFNLDIVSAQKIEEDLKTSLGEGYTLPKDPIEVLEGAIFEALGSSEPIFARAIPATLVPNES